MRVLESVSWDQFVFMQVFVADNLSFLLDNFFTYSENKKLNSCVYVVTWLSRNTSLIFTVKLIISIMLLILVRGGTPRYRYDYLTKLGWLKFFGLVIVFFLTLLLTSFLF